LTTSGGCLFNSRSHATGTITTTYGTPKLIQPRNEIGRYDGSAPSVEFRMPRAMPFGGVPMIVPTPPIDAAQAMPSITAVPYRDFPGSASNIERRPSPIGIIIAAAAVFEIHIEMNAVAHIIPRRIFLESPAIVPLVRNQSVNLRSSFHFCIAAARRNPPRKRKMTGAA
jgi:hypothetical protein